MLVNLTPTKVMKVLSLKMSVLLRVGSGMGRYPSITLGKLSEREFLVSLI